MSKKVMIEVDEDALKVLDDHIKGCYSHQLWWKHNHGFDNDLGGELCHPYQFALNDRDEAKKLAKAFGLYPYNQPIVRNP